MGRSASEILLEYLAAQASGDLQETLRMIADDAVFDVGRGRFEGAEQIRGFLERLRSVRSRTTVIELHDDSGGRAQAVFEQRDDDLVPLGIEHLRLNVQVEVTPGDRIKTFTARPTADSIRALTAAREARRTSEGLQQAERAGTLPPKARH